MERVGGRVAMESIGEMFSNEYASSFFFFFFFFILLFLLLLLLLIRMERFVGCTKEQPQPKQSH